MIPVLLFAKAPRPGFVKTRLAAAVGEEEAVRVYRALGERVVRQVAPVSHITVWYDPADALFEMRAWLGSSLDYRAQPGGDLGVRLREGFARHFSEWADRPALAIGVDAPALDSTIVASAARALERTDVVIGPALDGGYYLLGLRAPQPTLLEGIPWSTDRVFAETRSRCERIGITPHVLPPLRDVDTRADAVAFGLIALDR